MAASLVHAFVSGKSNGSDGTLVQPSNWNAAHVLSGATQGDLIVAATSTTTGSIAAVAVGQVLVSGGVGVAPAWSASPTLTSVLNVAGATLTIGTTDAHDTIIQANGSSVRFDAAGNFRPSTDNNLSLGSASDRWESGYFATMLAVGTNPASSAATIAVPSAFAFNARNHANSADVLVLATDTNDVVILGGTNAGGISLQPASGDIKWGKALVAVGGGATATFGTIGGSGPATAGQDSWMRHLDSTGAACWVPVWK